MQFKILGPLEVWDGTRRLPLGGPQHRAVLAVLLLNANRVVSTDQLVDSLWADRPRSASRSLLQGCVAGLRRTFRASEDPSARQALVTSRPGYLLTVRPGDLDFDRFKELTAGADRLVAQTSVTAWQEAVALYHEALSLWRGPALEDVGLDACRAERAWLKELQLAVLEQRVEVELRLRRHHSLIGELRALVASYPLRENLWALLMVGLHGVGRQADALAAFRDARHALTDQLAVEPGETLQQVHRAILSGADPLPVYLRARGLTPADPQTLTVEREPAPDQAGHGTPALLPPSVSAFTGRTRYLKQLDELLAESADETTAVVISAIAGTPGVGKTALAVHWAHRVRSRFDDGQLYINLRGYASAPPTRPIDALAALLRALGMPAQQVPVDQDEATGVYRSLLAGKRVLILLDNAGSADQVRPLLPASPGCFVLITSRDRMAGLAAHDGARRLTLDALPPDEAQVLLARVLGAERTHAEPAATAELAALCAHLPLALRIAAANLADHAGLSIADYVDELRGGNLLASLEVDDDPEAAVRAAFDLSYARQTPAAQRLFRLLGLVPGPDITAEAAAALADISPATAGHLLDRLAAAHLVGEHAAGRYALHDLLRLYAAERAEADHDDDDRQAVIRRLHGWYLHTADNAAQQLYRPMLRLPLSGAEPSARSSAFADHLKARAWLDAERPNLVAAVEHSATYGPRSAAWSLADTLRGYFLLSMQTLDWLTVARAGLSAAQADHQPRAEAAARLSLGDAHQRVSRYKESIEHYEHSLNLSRQSGWLAGQAAVRGNLGNVYWRSGQPQVAAEHYTDALALCRQAGLVTGECACLGNLGIVSWQLGRLAQATEYHSRAVAAARQLDWRAGVAIGLGNLGETYLDLGRLEDALDHLHQALALHREIGDRGNEANALNLLAAVHRDAGGLSAAVDFAHKALALARDAGDRPVEANVLNTLATIHNRMNRYQRAAEVQQEALELVRQTDERHSEAVALVGLSATYRRLQALDRAETYVQAALALTVSVGYRTLEGQAQSELAAIRLAQAEPEEAVREAEKALVIHRETGHRLGLARTQVVLGEALLRAGRTDAAAREWRAALTLFTDIGTTEADHVRVRLTRLAADDQL